MQKIRIGSITYAMKARRQLSLRGIHAGLIKTDGGENEGCVYGIEIPEDRLLQAITVLRESRIEYRSVKDEK